MVWSHVLGTFSCQEGSQPLEESLGRGSLHARVPSGDGVDPPVPPAQGGTHTLGCPMWGAWPPQLIPQPQATPAVAGQAPWSTGTVPPGCQEGGGCSPHARTRAAAKSQATPLLHNSSLCKLPAPHWLLLPSHSHRPGDAEGSHPLAPSVSPRRWDPEPSITHPAGPPVPKLDRSAPGAVAAATAVA